MTEQQRAMSATQTANFAEKVSRDIALRALTQLQHGYLVLTEDGVVVGEFGNKQDPLKARIDVHHTRMYRRFIFNGDIGAGESYIDRDWSSPDLTSVIRLFAQNLDAMDAISQRYGWLTWPFQKLAFLARRNSKSKAKQNILSHYDLGNELYTRFLDPLMQYSSAVYPNPAASLDQAQQHKLQRLCDMLDIQPGDHVVEIGTGWGGLAVYIAQHYDCHVTTTTISDAQLAYAQSKVESLGLSDKVTLLNQDYRDLTGQFDKLVSVEMIEAVGKEYLPSFFKQCSRLLKPQGRMVLQAITIADQRMQRYNRDVDFIQQHVFPGGYLPSNELLHTLTRKHTDMVIRQVDDIGLHYARTLEDWRVAFNAKHSELQTLGYDERFSRFWNYYLSYCEGGFIERRVSAVQLMATKPSAKEALRTVSGNYCATS
ncbi:SAM-dependent methyltransferase [Aliidiomarina maris]|uniref:Cyclopropane-fatty-acyl-phospholipid synthase n=1 Tax=Aliidiomarina maris TaxID=531312 RepID=A0A327WZ90_9GAMM|nr:cyclopropane-fatty-acyl-phospholipid synthase family protein [Aliidiomarina maris]MBA3988486.1 SAM-dependent methyltransferase [Idiomarina sp.]RAJ98829.1 cyclopropane-fatty-acyl-phospholipid synthase [Aliidiomarina maris]RUO24977.1 SAM-dependent methyltransferase [Aliidiomarina maris]